MESGESFERGIRAMKRQEKPYAAGVIAAVSLVAAIMGLAAGAFGQAKPGIVTANLDDILKKNPLAVGQTAKATPVTKVPGAELQVIEMSKIKLHSHHQEDHIVFVVRGKGTVHMDQETRDVKPGDIFMLPKDVPHGFSKSGDENLVLLVVGTPGWKPLEDTKFHE
jgi:mannose-6-phosphate isomerase-like protein (cupin superfamily)